MHFKPRSSRQDYHCTVDVSGVDDMPVAYMTRPTVIQPDQVTFEFWANPKTSEWCLQCIRITGWRVNKDESLSKTMRHENYYSGPKLGDAPEWAGGIAQLLLPGEEKLIPLPDVA
jgi:hypothetical protein